MTSGKGARRKGADFERSIERWLDNAPGITRAWRTAPLGHPGADIHALTDAGPGLSIECKNRATPDLPGWWRQTVADTDHYNRTHLDALHPVLVWKRRGVTAPQDQWAVMTLGAFTELIDAMRQP